MPTIEENELGSTPPGLLTPLGELQFRPLVTVPATSSLGEVARQFREHDVSSALVGPSSFMIVTERDLTRALAEGKGPTTPVEAVATRAPIWATTTSYVADAADIMVRYEVRHLIVLTPGGEPVGVLSMRDVFSVLLKEAREHV